VPIVPALSGSSTRVHAIAWSHDCGVFTVSDVMTREVVTAAPETRFQEAVRLLKQNRVSGLPVVDRNGKLVGVVSEADLLNKAEKREPDAYVLESRRHRLDRSRASALDVASAMSRDVVTLPPDAPIALAAREMHARGFKRLPVVDAQGHLVGIVSRGDVLKVFLRTDADLAAEVRRILEHAQAEFGGLALAATVTGGVVDLTGSMKSKNQVDATVRAVAGVDGVIGISSRVTYDTDDAEFVSLSLERRPR
jgi:CBS domain-containing protein